MVPLRSLLTMASSEKSTMAASRCPSLGPLALCHIYSSTNKLDELAVFIENRMTRGIDMPNCSVWQKNPVLGEGINSFAKRLLKFLLYPIAILGVDLLPKIVSRR